MLRSIRASAMLAALASPFGAAAAEPARPVGSAGSAGSAIVQSVVVEGGKSPRAVLRCLGEDGTLELDPGVVPFGLKPAGSRAAVTLPRKEGVVTCTLPRGGKGGLRLRPIQLRAVSPSVPHDDKGGRIVLSLDGQALGPRLSADDDVYLVWRGAIRSATSMAPHTCPEARWSDDRVVVCLDPAAVSGRGPARVRIQSAGRLGEAAGEPIAFPSGASR